jgi:uncharacterized protein YprB with RNaseH-like and TPR domain
MSVPSDRVRGEQARLRKRLGDLLRRRDEQRGEVPGATAMPELRSPAPAELASGAAIDPICGRAELEGLLPGHEATTPLGSLHIHEVTLGVDDRGYASLLGKLADARERLELLSSESEGIDPAFAAIKRSGLEGVLLLDLETAGLAGNPVFLAGLLTITPDRLHLRQLLARNYLEEPALLAEVAATVRRWPVLVTYNGKSFDVPMLVDRACRHGIRWTQPEVHLDLLHHARRVYRGRAPDCRLVTLEWTVFQRRRYGDVAGREIPGRFHRFARDGDPTAVLPILHHNALDLVTLAELLAHLTPYPPGPRFVPDDEEFETGLWGDSTETRLRRGVG